MKSKLLKITSLLSLIFASVFALFLVVFACGIGEVVKLVPTRIGNMAIIALCWLISCDVCEMVFSALLVAGKTNFSFMPQINQYITPLHKQKVHGNLITAIVFNILLTGFSIFLLALNLSWFVIAVCVLEALASLTCAILMIVGYCKKEEKSQQNIENDRQQAPPKKQGVEAKLEKLADMRARGLITEEEYKLLRADCIKKSI